MASFSFIFHLSRLRGKGNAEVERVSGGEGRKGFKGMAELECQKTGQVFSKRDDVTS